MRRILTLLVLWLPAAALAQSATTPVSLCELLKNPPVYDRARLDVTAFVAFGFEDFTLFDPRCAPISQSVWVEYGGRRSSGAIYCCGEDDSRETPLAVDGIPTTLVKDANLKRFSTALARDEDAVVYATLRGRFFAGEQLVFPGATFWGGYGHFGMFSLFVIEQVVAVDPDHLNLTGIDYRAHPDRPDFTCSLQPLGQPAYDEVFQLQRNAERRGRRWKFTDPARVAREYLQTVRPEISVGTVKVHRERPGRVMYEITSPAAADRRYWVLVSRPYWLTFVARDRRRIAWIPIAAYETDCHGITPS